MTILKPHIYSEEDDLMTLLETECSYSTLIIKPCKRGNIGRFINGKKPDDKSGILNVFYNVQFY